MYEKIIPVPGAPEFSGGDTTGDPSPYVPRVNEIQLQNEQTDIKPSDSPATSNENSPDTN